jgi:hypothetical protein
MGLLVVVSLAARPCQAQEKPVGTPERLPAAVPAPAELPVAPLSSAPCACPVEKIHTTYQLHWLERDTPVPMEKLSLRAESTQEVRAVPELDWVETTEVRTEIVLKPREILKEVTVCTVKPEKITDPATGCCSTVMQPVTEVKQVKETVFDMVREEKLVKVRRPVLKSTDRVFDVKHLVLDRQVEMRKERYGVLVPSQVTERILVPPAACGAHP